MPYNKKIKFRFTSKFKNNNKCFFDENVSIFGFIKIEIIAVFGKSAAIVSPKESICVEKLVERHCWILEYDLKSRNVFQL